MFHVEHSGVDTRVAGRNQLYRHRLCLRPWGARVLARNRGRRQLVRQGTRSWPSRPGSLDPGRSPDHRARWPGHREPTSRECSTWNSPRSEDPWSAAAQVIHSRDNPYGAGRSSPRSGTDGPQKGETWGNSHDRVRGRLLTLHSEPTSRTAAQREVGGGASCPARQEPRRRSEPPLRSQLVEEAIQVLLTVVLDHELSAVARSVLD